MRCRRFHAILGHRISAANRRLDHQQRRRLTCITKRQHTHGGRVWRTPPQAAGRDSLAPTLMAAPLPPVSSTQSYLEGDPRWRHVEQVCDLQSGVQSLARCGQKKRYTKRTQGWCGSPKNQLWCTCFFVHREPGYSRCVVRCILCRPPCQRQRQWYSPPTASTSSTTSDCHRHCQQHRTVSHGVLKKAAVAGFGDCQTSHLPCSPIGLGDSPLVFPCR